MRQPITTPTLGRTQPPEKYVNIEARISRYYIAIFSAIFLLLITAVSLPLITLMSDSTVIFKNRLITIVSYIVAMLFLTLTILLAVAVTVLIKTLSSSEIFSSMFENEISTLRNILIAFCSSYTLRLLLDLTLAPMWLN